MKIDRFAKHMMAYQSNQKRILKKWGNKPISEFFAAGGAIYIDGQRFGYGKSSSLR